MFGLLGPNGAGKTSTIRMIMNIIVPDSGRISVLGNSDQNTNTDNIGYLPEERGMYRKMKVRNLLIFLAKLKNMDKSIIEKEIDYWLERLEIMDWKKKKIEELSKGMQQKIQFIATILHKPKLMILDEPFLGLDPINADLIKNVLLDLKREGRTIIFSTHLMEHAEKLCDEIVLINKGENILNGSIQEIKTRTGRLSIRIYYEGNDDFLKDSDLVEKLDNYGNYVEVELKKNVEPKQLALMAFNSVNVNKFEVVEPSLHDIFIETVKNTNSGINNSGNQHVN